MSNPSVRHLITILIEGSNGMVHLLVKPIYQSSSQFGLLNFIHSQEFLSILRYDVTILNSQSLVQIYKKMKIASKHFAIETFQTIGPKQTSVVKSVNEVILYLYKRS